MKFSLKKAFTIFILVLLFWGPIGCENKKELSQNEKIVAEAANSDAFVSNLNEPDSATLYSLEPSRTESHYNFRGYQILGELKLSPEEINTVTLEFKDAIDSFKEGMPIAACFRPRVGLRVVKAGKTSDFALCYECHRMVGYNASNTEYSFDIIGNPAKLNSILTSAKIPVSSPPKANREM